MSAWPTSAAALRRRREAEAYEQDRGPDALARQVELGQLLTRCCGEPVDGPHHPACRRGWRVGRRVK